MSSDFLERPLLLPAGRALKLKRVRRGGKREWIMVRGRLIVVLLDFRQKCPSILRLSHRKSPYDRSVRASLLNVFIPFRRPHTGGFFGDSLETTTKGGFYFPRARFYPFWIRLSLSSITAAGIASQPTRRDVLFCSHSQVARGK